MGQETDEKAEGTAWEEERKALALVKSQVKSAISASRVLAADFIMVIV